METNEALEQAISYAKEYLKENPDQKSRVMSLIRLMDAEIDGGEDSFRELNNFLHALREEEEDEEDD